ncbi:hypothetical protein BRADI_1g07222v3 [Brachypodium distachyon]|uniref:Uncharacterized protein n=1 Tax=Brachypodium distachyon TaxID=15368 RepID=A0A2K2DIF4_BRADI|nr:hypothetical protein BRADI_1g07222v3 [Brachypodium distachyon]
MSRETGLMTLRMKDVFIGTGPDRPGPNPIASGRRMPGPDRQGSSGWPGWAPIPTAPAPGRLHTPTPCCHYCLLCSYQFERPVGDLVGVPRARPDGRGDRPYSTTTPAIHCPGPSCTSSYCPVPCVSCYSSPGFGFIYYRFGSSLLLSMKACRMPWNLRSFDFASGRRGEFG